MKAHHSFALLLLMALVPACGGGISSGKTLVTIDGDTITEGDLNFLSDINPRIKAQIMNPTSRKRILDNLVEQDLLYKEAVKKGVNRDSKTKAKVDLYRHVIVAQSLIEAEVQKAAKEYYDKNPDEFRKLELAHIMINYGTLPAPVVPKGKKAVVVAKGRSEEEALKLATAVKARLDKGEPFATVAKEVSDDTATKNYGGSLGKVAKKDARIEARGFGALLDKAFDLKVAEIAGPIKTDKGYHLITVTAGAELEPFEVAQERILMKVEGDTREALLGRLKKQAKIVYASEAAPSPAPAAGDQPATTPPAPSAAAPTAPPTSAAPPPPPAPPAPRATKK